MIEEALRALVERIEAEHVWAEPDEEGSCLRCHASMILDDGAEPTPLCHACAQELLVEVADTIRSIVGQPQVEEVHHEWWCESIAKECSCGAESAVADREKKAKS